MPYTPLPIGIDDYEKIITGGYYYVDKTWLIKELLDKKGEANLFTRPRRFGKTLNQSMLRYYFEKPIDGNSNKHLFANMKIMSAGERYTSEQEKYPVISLTLKSAKQPTFEMAHASLVEEIAAEYARHSYVLDSTEILEEDKEKFMRIRGRGASDIDYAKAFAFLSMCLYRYHQQKVIILVDEYDVPLENAYYAGFYDEIVAFIRSLFESALKTNPYLEFSVITGCLNISLEKFALQTSNGSAYAETIFTGLNNLKIISILNKEYGEHFGFVEEEVKEMLTYYHREQNMSTMKEWYDGYQFGSTEVYNPWSVINYTASILSDENAFPTAEWSNTSSNSIVKDLIFRADEETKSDLEVLMNGETIEKKVHEDITYDDIYESDENLWNFLLFTGYLKQVSLRMEGFNRYVTMAIPNNELLYIYENTIEKWFRIKIETQDLSDLYEAMFTGDAQAFEQSVVTRLRQSISYMDYAESFYHGFLLGLMVNLKSYRIKSNRESGEGRYDLCVYSLDVSIPPILLELKIAKKYKEMATACDKALLQIEEKNYIAEWEEEGYKEIICYGIGFYKKQMQVKMKRMKIEE